VASGDVYSTSENTSDEIRTGLNGFGRIGRTIFGAALTGADLIGVQVLERAA
jgi:glyceraldehyde-3-phosphate dehydrogenase/erythrose-4-phosphate dehydrogenase